jgi:hypothetical protein
MSYIINKTDGSVLTEVVDGTIDQTSTDLTLVGKNSSSYGEFLNENFIKLLESFANTNAPNNPITGQIWYDTTEGRLKVYDGNGFRVSGGTIVSNKVPSNLVQGDIWIDSYRKQLFFYDGTQLTLAGPQFNDQQGLTGLTIETYLDTNQISHTLAMMYVGQALLGIWSKDEFTPATPITGAKPGKIYRGFNTSSLTGVEFKGIISQARGLLNNAGQVKVPEDFVSVTDAVTTFQGAVTINNTVPLTLGPGPSTEIRVTNAEFNITSLQSNQEIAIKTKFGLSPITAIRIKPATSRVGIFTDAPNAMLDVNGDTIIRGNLTVNGTTTSIETTNISIKDLNLELGNVATPTDDTADGGGLILKGTTDHSMLWTKDAIAPEDSNWVFTDHVSLDAGKEFKINNVSVLTATRLGSQVRDSSLRTVGNLDLLEVVNLKLENNTISSTNTNGNIIISPNGSGVVDVASSIIRGIATPVQSTDAVPLQYLLDRVSTTSIGYELDITGLSAVESTLKTQIATILQTIFPIVSPETSLREHPENTRCRVLCTKQTVSFPALNVAPGFDITYNSAIGEADTGTLVTTPSGEATIYGVLPASQVPVVEDFAINTVNTGAATITYTRAVRTFIVSSGAWTWESSGTEIVL